MDDVGHYFYGFIVGVVPDLALLTEIWHLAHFILLAHFLGWTHRSKACHLLGLRHLWIQCVDLP